MCFLYGAYELNDRYFPVTGTPLTPGELCRENTRLSYSSLGESSAFYCALGEGCYLLLMFEL